MRKTSVTPGWDCHQNRTGSPPQVRKSNNYKFVGRNRKHATSKCSKKIVNTISTIRSGISKNKTLWAADFVIFSIVSFRKCNRTERNRSGLLTKLDHSGPMSWLWLTSLCHEFRPGIQSMYRYCIRPIKMPLYQEMAKFQLYPCPLEWTLNWHEI